MSVELLNGKFDFTRTLLAPSGTKFIACNSLEMRKSWRVHGKLGCYLGLACNHHKHHKVCMSSTREIIATDTIKHTEDNLFETPCASNEDNPLDGTNELATLLQKQTPLQCHNTNLRKTAIERLQDFLLKTLHHFRG